MCLSFIIKAKKLHDSKFLHHESTTNYVNTQSITAANKEFTSYIRNANSHLALAAEALENMNNIKEFVYMRNQLLLARIHLVGNTNLLTAEYLKTSGHAGENIRSILLELVQSLKLTSHENIVLNTLTTNFMSILLSYNRAVDEFEEEYPDKTTILMKIIIRNSKKINDILKKLE